jgi:hypothetical protein
MPTFGKERVSKKPLDAAKKIFSLSSLSLFNFNEFQKKISVKDIAGPSTPKAGSAKDHPTRRS